MWWSPLLSLSLSATVSVCSDWKLEQWSGGGKERKGGRRGNGGGGLRPVGSGVIIIGWRVSRGQGTAVC